MTNRLNFLNIIFKNNRIKFTFEKWKHETIVAHKMRKEIQIQNKRARLNPSSHQREKMLRFMKGLLVIQNKSSLKKYDIMAQAESKMTVGKAIALWKINYGV